MRIYLFPFLLLFVISACETTKNSTSSAKEVFDGSVQVNVLFSDTLEKSKELNLYTWQGIQVEKVDAVTGTVSTAGLSYQFFVENLDEGMYYVGYSLQDMKSFLLSGESSIELSGTSASVKDLTLKSPLNDQFNSLSKRVKSMNKRQLDLIFEYNQKKGNAEVLQEIMTSMKEVDSKKKALLDSLSVEPILYRFMAMNAFQSYQNNRSDGDTEARYFADHFFEHVNLADTGMYKLPMFYEAVKHYAKSLTQMSLSNNQQLNYVDTLLQSVGNSRNELPSIVACMLGTMGKNNSIFVKVGSLFLKKYTGRYPQLDKFVRDQLDQLRGSLAVGFEAPGLVGPNPQGESISLSDFRGKYVLIDFWASWCGPCRRENPNVVRMYQKYKTKGFEILGVSLDNNKDKWINAIAKDQLTWPHMSDLKGWASSHAKKYGVRGIPFTVLVDPQGKVVATKLRGSQLEKKLSEIFDS